MDVFLLGVGEGARSVWPSWGVEGGKTRRGRFGKWSLICELFLSCRTYDFVSPVFGCSVWEAAVYEEL